MAGPDRHAPDDVTAASLAADPPAPHEAAGTGAHADALALLARDPTRFDLFAAIRLWEAADPSAPPLGTAKRARDEGLRLSQPPHLAFPASDVVALEPGTKARPPRLRALGFGLFGPAGPLPLHLTADTLHRTRHLRDPAQADFFDLFHHRMAALHYRAWAAARPLVGQDRPGADGTEAKLHALAGLPTAGGRPDSPVPARLAAFLAGLLSLRARPPEALCRAVGLLFRVPTAVEEFRGGWLDIPPSLQTRLGLADGSTRLGVDAVLGRRSRAPHTRFRLVLGPLDRRAFDRFLPPPRGEADPGPLRALRRLVGALAGAELGWDLQLVLAGAQVPAARLDGGTRLGFTAWLGPRGGRGDAGDVVLAGDDGPGRA